MVRALRADFQLLKESFFAVEHLRPDETVLEVPSYRYSTHFHGHGFLAASGADAFRILLPGYCRPILTWIHDDSDADEFYR